LGNLRLQRCKFFHQDERGKLLSLEKNFLFPELHYQVEFKNWRINNEKDVNLIFGVAKWPYVVVSK